jgi:hypothetical protein
LVNDLLIVAGLGLASANNKYHLKVNEQSKNTSVEAGIALADRAHFVVSFLHRKPKQKATRELPNFSAQLHRPK